jgi:hypothetical protein
MLHKGLQVVWHYTYSTGDCFYASVSYLTQHLPHSHGVRRRLSMEEVRTIAAREVYQRPELFEFTDFDSDGGMLRQMQRYNESIGRPACLSPGYEGWADDLEASLTASALAIIVHVHFGDGKPSAVYGASADGRQLPCYHLLHTGPVDRGHFRPCLPLATGAMAQAHVNTTHALDR